MNHKSVETIRGPDSNRLPFKSQSQYNHKMKNHTKVYLSEMGFDTSDFIPCEVCTLRAVDIHHIENRGMGGSKVKDIIINLMALCRKCHDAFGDKKHLIPMLQNFHYKALLRRGHRQHN